MKRIDDAELAKLWNSPSLLLDRIDESLDSLGVDELPLWMLSEGDGPHREEQDGRPLHRILNRMLDEKRELLQDWACVRFGYCEAKVRHGETIALGKAIGDSLWSVWVMFPLPVATLVCYCVQSLFLDKLCDCASHRS